MRKKTMHRLVRLLEDEVRTVRSDFKFMQRQTKELAESRLAFRTERDDLKAKLADALDGFERSSTPDVYAADLERQLAASQAQVMDLTSKLKESKADVERLINQIGKTPPRWTTLQEKVEYVRSLMDEDVKPFLWGEREHPKLHEGLSRLNAVIKGKVYRTDIDIDPGTATERELRAAVFKQQPHQFAEPIGHIGKCMRCGLPYEDPIHVEFPPPGKKLVVEGDKQILVDDDELLMERNVALGYVDGVIKKQDGDRQEIFPFHGLEWGERRDQWWQESLKFEGATYDLPFFLHYAAITRAFAEWQEQHMPITTDERERRRQETAE